MALQEKQIAAFYHKIALGDAFIFELDASFLATVHVPYKRFGTLSKYPPIVRDVSFMIPVSTTAAQLQNEIAMWIALSRM